MPQTSTAAARSIVCPGENCTGIATPPTPGTTEVGHYCETCGRAWDVAKVERDGRLRLEACGVCQGCQNDDGCYQD